MSDVMAAEQLSALQEMLITPGPLHSSHQQLEGGCNACHTSFEREKRDQLCLDCHQTVSADMQAETGFHGRSEARNCARCHTEHKGADASITLFDRQQFNHQQTDFGLGGAHELLACNDCHNDEQRLNNADKGQWRIEQHQCSDCHADPHETAFSASCTDCHNDSRWYQTLFDHDKTRFPLTDKHATTVCDACHSDLKFTAPLQCNDCHAVHDVHRGTMGASCDDCHSSTGWKEPRFDHADTRFPLRGAHGDTACLLCHGDTQVDLAGLFVDDAPVADQCQHCHGAEDIHRGTFGSDCSACHDEKQWSRARFDHDQVKAFPLTGKHKGLDCIGCHAPGSEEAFAIPSGSARTACKDCHGGRDVHQGELGERCESCHSDARNWPETRFDHEFTDFPLIGIHRIVACHACHGDQRFQLPLSQCDDCHTPGEAHSEVFSTDCEGCHQSTSWDRWSFDHSITQFPLEGAHQQAACLDCHNSAIVSGPQFTPDKPSTACYACHAEDDVHEQRFGRQCGNCHNQSRFKDVLQRRGR
ncbi:MAG: hypothetical protein KDI36_03410 [Pseudomonadales bacterium]|nr:hypothetical protein [Pseudomonadales bacterium]